MFAQVRFAHSIQSAAASDPAVSTRPTRTSATAAAFPFNGDACSVGPGASRRAARLSTPGTTAHRNSPKQPVTFVTDEMSG